MVEALHSAPLFVYGPFKPLYQHTWQDRVYQWRQQIYIVRNINFYDIILTAAIIGVDLNFVEAELFRIVRSGTGQPYQAIYSGRYNRCFAGYVIAACILQLLSGYGKAYGLPSGVVDRDLGLYQAGDVNDAKNEQEEEGYPKSKLHHVLASALVMATE
jgi:hypothetical protein